MTQVLRFQVDAAEKRRMRKASRRQNAWALPLGEAISVALGVLAGVALREVPLPLLQVGLPLAVLVSGSVYTNALCRRHLENPAFYMRGEEIALQKQTMMWDFSRPDRTEFRRNVWEIPYSAIRALDMDAEKHLLRITWQTEDRQVKQEDIYLYYHDQERMLRELSARCAREIRQTPLSEG